MEILTEQQQVARQAKEAFEAYQYMDNELQKMKTALFNYRMRFFKSERTERSKSFDVKELEKVVSQLFYYQSFLYKELEKYKPKS